MPTAAGKVVEPGPGPWDRGCRRSNRFRSRPLGLPGGFLRPASLLESGAVASATIDLKPVAIRNRSPMPLVVIVLLVTGDVAGTSAEEAVCFEPMKPIGVVAVDEDVRGLI